MTDVQFDPNSSGWVETDSDPITGIKTYELDLGNGYVVERKESVMTDAIIENNQKIANLTDGKRWGDGQIAASIPLNIYYKHLLPAIKAGDQAFVKRFLNDSDNAKFRTKRGVI